MNPYALFEDQLIVITGAAGFIGSGVVRHLNDLGYTNLLLVDDFYETDKWKNLIGKKFVDIISKKELFSFLLGKEREIGAIIHLGACSSTVENDGNYLMENNYRFSVKLATYALREDIRFIYASSAATYGLAEKGFNDDEEELFCLKPLNMYGFSKHLFDLWLLREKALEKVIGIKYFNVFGPNEYHKGRMASMVLKMAKIAEKGSPIQLFKSNDPRFKDGEQKRDFIYVKDAVRFTCKFLEPSLRKIGGIYNIGSGSAVSWNQLASALFSALKKKPLVEYIDMPKDLQKQYQNFTKANMVKFFALNEDSIEPLSMTPIEEAVEEYVQKYILKGERW